VTRRRRPGSSKRCPRINAAASREDQPFVHIGQFRRPSQISDEIPCQDQQHRLIVLTGHSLRAHRWLTVPMPQRIRVLSELASFGLDRQRKLLPRCVDADALLQTLFEPLGTRFKLQLFL
jgi:hypothetical protein